MPFCPCDWCAPPRISALPVGRRSPYDHGWEGTLRACAAFWQPETHGVTLAGATTAAGPRRRAGPGRSTGGGGDVASASAEVSAATDLWLGEHAGAVKKASEAAAQLADAGEPSTPRSGATWRPTPTSIEDAPKISSPGSSRAASPSTAALRRVGA